MRIVKLLLMGLAALHHIYGQEIMGIGEPIAGSSADGDGGTFNTRLDQGVKVSTYGVNYTMCRSQVCSTRFCKEQGAPFEVAGYCFCDDSCFNAGDCCDNYASACFGPRRKQQRKQPDLTEALDNAVHATKETGMSGDPHPFTSCYSIDFDMGRGTIKLVDSCPLNSVEDEETINKCSGEGLDDLYKTAPVAYQHYNDTPKLYRNIHCLYCHQGRKLNRAPEYFIQTRPTYDCSDIGIRDEALAMALNGTSNSLIISFIHHYCRFFIDTTGIAAIFKSQLFKLMKCHYQDECDFSKFNGTLEEFEHVENLCRAYRSDVRVDGRDIMYKNPHCAMCNGVTDLDLLTCDNEIPPYMANSPGSRPVFQLAMSLTSSGDDRITYRGIPLCPTGQFYDYITEQCASQSCGPGEVLINNTCSFINDSITLPSFPMTKEMQLYMTLLIYIIGPENESITLLLNEHIKSIHGMKPEMFHRCGEHYGLLMKEHNFVDLCIKVKDEFILLTPKILGIESSESDSVKRLRLGNFIKENGPFSPNMTMHIFISPVASLTSGLDKFYCDEASNDTRALTLYQSLQLSAQYDENNFKVMFILGSNTYEYKETPYICHTKFEPSSLTSSKCEYSALACVPHILACDHQMVPMSDVRLRKHHVKIKGTREIIQKGYYAQLDSEWMVVCKNIGRRQIADDKEEQIREILTFAGNVISCCLLAFTLFTYSLFKPLRTLPGICIMNLILALMFAQFTFQIGQILRDFSEICTVLAVFQHYIWLTAFLWMSCLAYTSYKTVKHAISKTTNDLDNRNKTWVRIAGMCIFAWGLPAIFVCLCVILSNYGIITFKYGSSVSCWIVDSIGMVYLFAVPLAAISLFNLTLFGLTLHSLRQTLDIAELVLEGDNNIKAKERVAIYIKLSTVMGFTWIFGFLANLTVFGIFWYFFIVFNTLQGVAICWYFVINRYVMTMYGIREHHSNNSTLDPSTTAQNVPDSFKAQTI